MTRIASAAWRRLDVPGTDTCTLLRTEHGWTLAGLAEFAHARGWACVSYRVDCDPDWKSRSAEVHGTLGPHHFAYRIRKDGAWLINDVPTPETGALVDIDFGFTPATNFMLMRRLSFPEGEAVSVSVAWFDLGETKITGLPQRYTRRSPTTFWYESPSANYEGLLVLADTGFVASYPGLWTLEATS
jgi:uncharacterized protein